MNAGVCALDSAMLRWQVLGDEESDAVQSVSINSPHTLPNPILMSDGYDDEDPLGLGVQLG